MLRSGSVKSSWIRFERWYFYQVWDPVLGLGVGLRLDFKFQNFKRLCWLQTARRDQKPLQNLWLEEMTVTTTLHDALPRTFETRSNFPKQMRGMRLAVHLINILILTTTAPEMTNQNSFYFTNQQTSSTSTALSFQLTDGRAEKKRQLLSQVWGYYERQKDNTELKNRFIYCRFTFSINSSTTTLCAHTRTMAFFWNKISTAASSIHRDRVATRPTPKVLL